jgi:hypothetical protein
MKAHPPVDLFAPMASPDRLHPQFGELCGSALHLKARDLMNTLLGRMGDPNGNFLRDFQKDGFHSRVFELASFAYLEEAGLVIDRSHERPDYLVSAGGFSAAIEALTANPPDRTGHGYLVAANGPVIPGRDIAQGRKRSTETNCKQPSQEARQGLPESAALQRETACLYDRAIFRGRGWVLF